MLYKVRKALLLTDVPSFAHAYKKAAQEAGVLLTVESEWKPLYRITGEVVIAGSKYLDSINPAYYSATVLILKENESFIPYIEKGINRFIFNYQNKNELISAFYAAEKTVIHATSKDLEQVIKDSETTRYALGDYDFNFVTNKFKYRGKAIYLPESHKKFLAEWLLNGHKDNSRRMIVCNLRKKLGADFLKDIDRFGQLKGVKDEQQSKESN